MAILNNKKSYIAVFGENRCEYVHLIVKGWLKRAKMTMITPRISSHVTRTVQKMPFIGSYLSDSVTIRNIELDSGDNDAWFRIHRETIDLTAAYCDLESPRIGRILEYYAKLLNTGKFKAYIKREMANQVFILLANLYAVKSCKDLKDKKVLMARTPLNLFVADHMRAVHGFDNPVEWTSSFCGAISLFAYYGWIIKETFCRGFTLNRPKKKFKLSNEAAWGYKKNMPRNDMLIDGAAFKREDILLLRQYKTADAQCGIALDEAAEKGFATESIPDIKINITGNILNMASFYYMVPLKTYFKLLFAGRSCLFYYIFLFHKTCLPVELLLNTYDIKCHLSTKDWGDIAETIIFNKYGAKNAIFNWSDLTFFTSYNHTFKSHNLFFTWGDIHYDFQDTGNYRIDDHINIGCIYRKVLKDVAGKAQTMAANLSRFNRTRKTVVFFDTSLDPYSYLNSHLFIEYMTLIEEYVRTHEEVNVLLKSKSKSGLSKDDVLNNYDGYIGIMNRLDGYGNFTNLDASEWFAEEAIAVSDVCITMGMTTTSTIALICGKDALYFDKVNNYHPFAKKYRGSIVFDDKHSLFDQIDNITGSRFRCGDILDQDLLRQYDAYQDDSALPRIKERLFAVTG